MPSQRLPRDACRPLRACCSSTVSCAAASAFVVGLLLLLPLIFSIALIAYSANTHSDFPPAQAQWRIAVGSLSLIVSCFAALALYLRYQNVLLMCGWAMSVLSYWLMVLFTLDLTSSFSACGSYVCPDYINPADASAAFARKDVAPGLDATCCILGLSVGAVLSARGRRIAGEIETTLAAAHTLGVTDGGEAGAAAAAPRKPFTTATATA